MEWKVGYRFTLEYLITKVVDDYVIAEIGDAENILSAEEMALAKLIQPAATELPKLDVTKPMRLLGSDEASFTFLQRATNGMLIIKWDSGSLDVIDESEVENIPEPKIKGGRLAVLAEDGSVYWGDNSPDSIYRLCRDLRVVGRKLVEITEGEGWSIEEDL